MQGRGHRAFRSGRAIDEHAFTAVWGSAFEDLLAQDLPDGRNIVDEYLKRRGWKETAPTREYMAGLRRSVISLYEVSEIVPGQSMALRDLVRGGDPVRVTERQGRAICTNGTGSRHASFPCAAGLSSAARSCSLITRQARSFSPRYAAWGAKRRAARRKLAADLGRPEATKAIRALLTPELQLSGAAFLFTNLWLARLLEDQSGPRLPEITDSDGEPFAFITLHFPLAAGRRRPRASRGARDRPLASAGKRQLLELVGRWCMQSQRRALAAAGDTPDHDDGRWRARARKRGDHSEGGDALGELRAAGRARAGAAGARLARPGACAIDRAAGAGAGARGNTEEAKAAQRFVARGGTRDSSAEPGCALPADA